MYTLHTHTNVCVASSHKITQVCSQMDEINWFIDEIFILSSRGGFQSIINNHMSNIHPIDF